MGTESTCQTAVRQAYRVAWSTSGFSSTSSGNIFNFLGLLTSGLAGTFGALLERESFGGGRCSTPPPNVSSAMMLVEVELLNKPMLPTAQAVESFRLLCGHHDSPVTTPAFHILPGQSAFCTGNHQNAH